MECGLDLCVVETGDGAALAAILLLGAMVIGAVFRVGFCLNPPAWVHLLLWPTVILPLAVLLMRPLRATLIVRQHRHCAAGMAL